MSNLTATHTFEMSGLGKAPFKLVSPPKDLSDYASLFWCEHCGTQIINRYFVKSSDNRISVVGIDCAHKTGDQGIIEAINRQKREIAAAKREAERTLARAKNDDRERAKFNGQTIADLQRLAAQKVDELGSNLAANLESEHPIITEMKGYGFIKSIQLQAYCGHSLTQAQLSVSCEILAKQRSGAKKKSKAYNEAHELVSTELGKLQEALLLHEAKIDQIRSEAAAFRM